MLNYYSRIFFVFVLLAIIAINADAQTIPTGRAISLDDIISLSRNIGGFLMVLGGIIASISIIVSGIIYLTAGSDPSRVKSAKDMLKASLIGSLILFGSGVIVNVIRMLATDPLGFFR